MDDARRAVQSATNKAETAARKAIELDHRFAGGYSALAGVKFNAKKWAEAEDLFQLALALDPSDPEVLEPYSTLLSNVGRLKDSLRVRQQQQALEPFIPLYNIHTAEIMQISGQSDATIPILEEAPVGSDSYSRNADLAKAYAAKGRFKEAADTLLAIRTNQVSRQSVEDSARIIRTAPAITTAPDTLPVIDGSLNFVYAYVGARERVLERYERNLEIGGITGTFYWIWDPVHAPVRKTERFKTIVRNMGLLDYWHARGWPDLCRTMGADDFVCD